MKYMLPKLRKFSEEVYPPHKPLFESLAAGQKPHTLMITCSDSRIDPNLVTQTLPGELFVLRNAGNIVPPFGASDGGEEAAIEFAVNGLGVSNIVVCGHSQCGAMSALMGEVNLDGLPSVRRWLEHAASTRNRALAVHGANCKGTHAIQENVLVQVDNLKTHPAVAAAVRKGQVRVYGWVYHFESGQIAIYDKKAGVFIPSSEVSTDQSGSDERFAL